MITNLSRRSFLVGSAAVIAATKLPPPVAEAAISPLPDGLRRIHGMDIYGPGFLNPHLGPAHALEFAVHRQGVQRPLWKTAMSTMGHMHWTAIPGHELIFPEGTCPIFKVNDTGIKLTLWSVINDADYIEEYWWRDGKLVSCVSRLLLPEARQKEEETVQPAARAFPWSLHP
jgi:hypothetical protein